jgi:hypothetical protein
MSLWLVLFFMFVTCMLYTVYRTQFTEKVFRTCLDRFEVLFR